MLNTIKDNYTKALLENSKEYGLDLKYLNKHMENRNFHDMSVIIEHIMEEEESKPKSQRLKNYHLLVEANALLMNYTEQIYG